MAFNEKQFRELIKETLLKLDKYSVDATNLLLGTCAQESAFGTYIEQINGPALGVFQMEPNTEKDIWENYLYYRNELVKTVYDICGVIGPDKFSLKTNLAYQITMARIHYLRVPEKLPDNLIGYSRYWKKYYNTEQGKGNDLVH